MIPAAPTRKKTRGETVFIVSQYHEKSNGETIVITGMETACCPDCGASLLYRDRKLRGVKDKAGQKKQCWLRRLRCEPCRRMHTEIPDFIQPRKHYDSEAIQGVIVSESCVAKEDCVADESTMRRWRNDWNESKEDIGQRLSSAYSKETDAYTPLVSSVTLLATIVGKVSCWLAHVMKLLINAGNKLFTRFAFCPNADSDRILSVGTNIKNGGSKNDKTNAKTGRRGGQEVQNHSATN
jgi:hypothetical protein